MVTDKEVLQDEWPVEYIFVNMLTPSGSNVHPSLCDLAHFGVVLFFCRLYSTTPLLLGRITETIRDVNDEPFNC